MSSSNLLRRVTQYWSCLNVYISDTVVSIYIDDSCVLTCRMYDIQETNWGIFSVDTNVKLNNFKIFK